MAQDGTEHHGQGHSRAVMVVAAGRQPHGGGGAFILPDAGFLTQIIASKGHIGHFRRYRRADPSEAMRRYQAAARLSGTAQTR
jgi:hypothetical protein